jgi:hypothetical protein
MVAAGARSRYHQYKQRHSRSVQAVMNARLAMNAQHEDGEVGGEDGMTIYMARDHF